MTPIETIREALQRIHHVATGQSDRAYMSIPADPRRDADLILSAAIDELEQLREHVRVLSGPARRLKHLDGLPDHDYCALDFSGADLRALLAALAATEPKVTP